MDGIPILLAARSVGGEADLDAALRELVVFGGKLTQRLLGFQSQWPTMSPAVGFGATRDVV